MSATHVVVHAHGDGAFQSRADNKPYVEGQINEVALLDAAMTSGKPGLALAIDLPDGSWVFAELSVRMLQAIAAAVRGIMLQSYGHDWAMEYDNEEAAGVERRGLRFVAEYVLAASTGPWAGWSPNDEVLPFE